MGEEHIVNADVKSDPQTPQENQAPNADGGAKPDESKMVPKARFDEVNEKRKEAEKTLADVADTLTADVPEEFRDLVPALPAPERIKWIRNAVSKGLFQKHPESGPDSKRPGGQPPQDLTGLSAHELMRRGYKT